MPATAPAFGFGTPFAGQIAFFRSKLNLPSERWDDIRRAAHDRAFIVAGVGKADLLEDLRGEMQTRMEDGRGLEAFRKDFRGIVQKHGWTGWTGEGTKAGEAWRTKVIYQTNMATSYSAGRYRQMTDPAYLRLRPFWRYVHNDGVMHPRPLHLSWNGLVLPHDHPFWKTHYTPNGWGCMCRVVPVDGPGAGDRTRPPENWDAIDSKTGAQFGIDRGFDYAPGANAATPLRDLVEQKLINLDAQIGAAMWENLKPALALEQRLAWDDALDAWLADPIARGRRHVVGAVTPEVLDALESRALPLPASAEVAIEDRMVVGAKQRRHEAAQDALLPTEWRRLPELLDAPSGTYFDTRSGKLIYLVSAGADAAVKAALEIDYRVKKRPERVNAIVAAYRQPDTLTQEMIARGLWIALR